MKPSIITLLVNHKKLGGKIDLAMANDIFVILQEYAQGVSKVTCYDRLLNILAIG